MEKISETDIVRSGIRILRERDIKLKKKYDIEGRLTPWDLEDIFFRANDFKGAYFSDCKHIQRKIFVSFDEKEKKENFLNFSFNDIMRMQFLPEDTIKATLICHDVFPGTKTKIECELSDGPEIYCETMNKNILNVFHLIKSEGLTDIFPRMYHLMGGDKNDKSKDKLLFRIKYLCDLISAYKENKPKYRPYMKKTGLVSR